MGALIIMLILLGVIYHVSSSVSGGSSNNAPATRPASTTKPAPAREPKKYDKDFWDLCLSGTAEAVQSAIPSWKEARKKDNLDNEVYALGIALIAAALNNGDEGVCKVLIDAGADMKVKDPDGRTALHLAIANPSKNPKIIDVLISAGSDVNAQDNKGETPLMVAAMASFDNSANIKALAKAGADIEARNNDRETSLMVAAIAPFDNSANIKALVNAGASVEATCEIAFQGGTANNNALMYAITSNNAANVRAIIEAGADVNRQMKGKAWQKGRYIDAIDVYQYPLHDAVTRRNIEILRLLLDAGAYANARNSWGHTPLFQAQRDGNIEAAKLLESRGATL